VVCFVKRGDFDDILPTAIHETAHLLPATPPVTAPAASSIESEREALVEWLRTDNPPDPLRPRWSPGHDQNFLRILLHLWWRAAMLGHFTTPGDIFDGANYDVSPVIFYWTSLASEPVRMQGATFAEILATPPPEDFDTLWRGDLTRWLDRNPQAVKEVCNV
jgi:hypothetical protein